MTNDLISPERVLVTGATGFVGGHIAAALCEDGTGLRLLVRPSSDLDRLPQSVRDALTKNDDDIELFEGDLTQQVSLDGICDGVDAVIHCACAVKGTFDESQASQEIFIRVNVDGTRNLARRVAAAGIRMVHLSSTAAMGPVTATKVDETTTCIPRAPYQISKRRAEIALCEMHERDGLDVVMLRPCLILGPGKHGGEPLKLFRLARWGLFPKIGGQMHQTKPLIDVRDVIQAATAALTRGEAGETYLIHSDADHTLDEILDVTRRLIGSARSGIPVPVPPVRGAAYVFEALAQVVSSFNPPITPGRLDLFLTDRRISIAKARRELGFEPQVRDLFDMLGPTFVGYVRDGQLNA